MEMTINTRSSKKRPVEYGMSDYYKFYTKNYPYKVEKRTYNEVISELNKFIVDEVVDTAKEFILPHRTGFIGIAKIKRGVTLLPDNTIINTNPPDWKATNKLWDEDPEAKEKKILVRHKNTHTGGYVYTIKYNKYNATFNNKAAMSFIATRDFKRAVTRRINDYSKEKYNAHELKF
jgi:hypothetical protein